MASYNDRQKWPTVHKLRAPVVVLNGGAGILGLAALTLGHEVLCCLEGQDSDGRETDRWNLPALSRPKRRPRKVEAEDLLVVGRGSTDIRYALSLKPAALLLDCRESTYEETAADHHATAVSNEYYPYRVRYNDATFGVPSWRERWWGVFLRKDVATVFVVDHNPQATIVDDLLPWHTYRHGLVEGQELTSHERSVLVLGLTPVFKWRDACSAELADAQPSFPAAHWAIDMVQRNLQHRQSFRLGPSRSYKDTCIGVWPGGVADLRPTRELWKRVLEDYKDKERT